MIMELTVITPEEFNLPTEKAKTILTAFAPKELEFTTLVGEYMEVISLPLEDALGKAMELKKRYIDIEKSINAIHKAEKDFYLNGGRFVDAQKNRYIVHITEHKKKLDSIIKYRELQDKAEKQKIIDARKETLKQYMSEVDHLDLSMSDEIFEAFLNVKKKEWEDSEELKRSNEIIAKIYQSETFEEFNAELFGSHIEERKKQLHSDKLLKIANYNGGDLGFELDSSELENAYNERLIILDGIRVERIKNEMQRLYNNSLNIINNDITNYISPLFDAQEFTDEWECLVNNLADNYYSRRQHLSSILHKMPNTIVLNDNVMLGDKVLCNINQLNENTINLYNASAGFEAWVNSFVAPEVINDDRCKVVLERFEQFKKWAVTL